MSVKAIRKSSPPLRSPDPLTAYLRDIQRKEKLTSCEEIILSRRIRKGDRQALAILVEANLKFVVAVALKFQDRGLAIPDLINEGNLGLIKAAHRFDETANCRFISYAVWWIRQSILGALASQTRTISVSSFTLALLAKVNWATRRLSQKLGRTPSMEELELETGIQAERIRHCLSLGDATASLDQADWQEDGSDAMEGWPDDSDSSPERLRERFHARRTLERVLPGLEPREREVLELYFGMESGAAWSLGDLARKYQLSREGIRKIKQRALAKVKALLRLTEVTACQETKKTERHASHG
jgi:RNA polymerase primary sigma factor